jgi:hypothetical protein
LWAYEFEAGKFIAGEILGDTLYMYAPTGRGEKWVMNSEGVVLEYSSEPFHKSDEIIAGINAHYGTSFYQEDDIDKDFTIGETMPNWNAYEKIEIKLQKLAVHTSNLSKYVIGYINESNEYVMQVFDSETFPIIAQNGEMSEVGSGLDGFKQYVILPILQQSEYAINTIVTEIIPSMQVGDIVPDWNSYAKI